MPYRRITQALKLLALLGLIAGGVFFFRFTETGQSITAQSIQDFLTSVGPLQARLLYVAIYIVGTVLLLPGTLLSFAGAVMFGAWEGTLWTWIGATLGATLAFYVARWLGREQVDHLLGGRLAALDERLREHGFTGMLILRLVPLFPFNGINFGAGLTSIRPRDYILGTALGILPGTFVYQFLFANLKEKVLQEGVSWSDLADPTLLTALALFVAFIALGHWLGRRLHR